jgi:hypothetical protein
MFNIICKSKFYKKRLAYLGIYMLLNEKSETPLLISNIIKIDLSNKNPYIKKRLFRLLVKIIISFLN